MSPIPELPFPLITMVGITVQAYEVTEMFSLASQKSGSLRFKCQAPTFSRLAVILPNSYSLLLRNLILKSIIHGFKKNTRHFPIFWFFCLSIGVSCTKLAPLLIEIS